MKRLAVNTSANFGLRLTTAVLSFVSVPVIVTALGADAFGVLLLAESIIGYFGVLNLGVPSAVVRFVARCSAHDDSEGINRTIRSSAVFFLLIGFLVAVSLICFALVGGLRLFRIPPDLLRDAEVVLFLAAAISLIRWPCRVFGSALEGLQRYELSGIAHGTGAILGTSSAIVAALLGASLPVVFVCQSCGVFIAAALNYWFLHRVFGSLALTPWKIDRETFRELIGFGGWVSLGELSKQLIYQTDRIILAVFLPVSAITIYHVVTRPFRLIQELSSLFNSAMMPAISAEAPSGGSAELDRFIYTATRYGNAFVAPIAIIGTFLSAPLIGLWMGPDYLPYAWIAQLGCLFQLVWQSNSTLARVFYGTGRVRETMTIALVAGIVNVPLGIWWVQLVGVAGVVLSTVAVGLVSVVLQYAYAMPVLGVDRKKYLTFSVIAAQSPSVIIGLAAAPLLWRAFQQISSWPELIGSAGISAAVLYAIAWFSVVSPRHRSLVSFSSLRERFREGKRRHG